MGWFAAAVGILDAGLGISGAGDQKKIDKAKAKLTYDQNLREIRSIEKQQAEDIGLTTALAGATGVNLNDGASTPNRYIALMTKEYAYELNWMREYAQRAKKLGIQQAGVNYKSNMYNSIKSGINTGASIYGMR